MTAGTAPAGQWLTLAELCAWLNISERHARKLVARNAIPYRKVGRLLRFTRSEIEQWSKPGSRPVRNRTACVPAVVPAIRSTARPVAWLPKSLIEYDAVKEPDDAAIKSG